MLPNRISVVSYNLWNVERWPDREQALRNYLLTFRPDILCLQELRDETRQSVAQSLTSHECVQDALPGWACESNIFWNKHYFKEIAHGLEKLDMPERHRGLFWVRLNVLGSERTMLIATAHYTWQGHPAELETGLTPRNRQVRDTISFLKKNVFEDEPAFLMGDLNDPVIPGRLFAQAGYHSCFRELNLICPPTYPALPTTDDVGENQAIDWIFCNGRAKAISAFVPQYYFKGIGPSDHWPVHAIYEL